MTCVLDALRSCRRCFSSFHLLPVTQELPEKQTWLLVDHGGERRPKKKVQPAMRDAKQIAIHEEASRSLLLPLAPCTVSSFAPSAFASHDLSGHLNAELRVQHLAKPASAMHDV
jgi:hypothetical protein